jgi:hypothetical protein
LAAKEAMKVTLFDFTEHDDREVRADAGEPMKDL